MILLNTVIEYNDLWSKVFKVPLIFSDKEIKDDAIFEAYRHQSIRRNKHVFVYVPKRLFPFIDADVLIINPRQCGKLSRMTEFQNNEHFHSIITKELSKSVYRELFD